MPTQPAAPFLETPASPAGKIAPGAESGIRPAPYCFHKPSELKPRGWLLRQLRIQADGLSGHLDQFWPDIADSAWIGGQHEGWERVPYWLDGFIPLAWLLEDADLKTRARRYVDRILAQQAEDGWLCPCRMEERAGYDLWALFLILKALTVYADATEDTRVAPAVSRALRQLDRHIDSHVLSGWGQTRWYEALISIYWLYSRQPEAWLRCLAVKLHSQGMDFPSLFADGWPYEQPEAKGRWSQMSHVVNQAMMLKGWALYSLVSGRSDDLAAASAMMAALDRWHGQVHGLFSGDECLAGTSPERGTELCAVVEFMYSMEQLIAVSGQPEWGDRLEQAAFNALPATFDPAMWTHQYDQQVNQVSCTSEPVSVFGTNGGQANLFGLEPNYGCCTANLSQGWPKFALSLILRRQARAAPETRSDAEDGLYIAAYAPARLETCIQNQPVSLEMDTEYPFREQIRFSVTAPADLSFPIEWRVPAWAKKPCLILAGHDGQTETFQLEPGTRFSLKRFWSRCHAIELRLPMAAEWIRRPAGRVALKRGPLVYALPVAETWRQINQDLPGHEAPHADYEVLPAGPWQFGLTSGQLNPAGITWTTQPPGDYPFSPGGAPVSATLEATPVSWSLYNGSARPEPDHRRPTGPARPVRLIPYGCTNLRLTEWPVLPDDPEQA